MVSNFQLPPIGFGPGSQLQDEDDELNYLAMPSGMRTYSPHLPEPELARAAAPALGLLAQIAEACDRVAKTGRPAAFDLAQLPDPSRKLIAETMGQGEVSLKVRGVPALAVQESVFAGVWMLAGSGVDRVEVSGVPSVALARAHLPHRPALGARAVRTPGVVNAPALYSELSDKSQSYQPGLATHAVNLTLLPHTAEDLAWLDEALGEGAVTVLSRGYGNCRITATALPHVWRVQYYNSMDVLILDTFEVTTIPEVVLAASEDLVDSAARIREVVEALR
ncbi:hydrogenase expression/formation protein [Tabrizicola sp. J26]|uniref:hydrogenase expression/formation protein n=1 Tax=Alitabrizicola rongguiensis TaxID=2909234 RepID=UPI001F2C2C5A|nr:hydrogenase expression/formation protein [Tabrizicola rongguiensis]MCF1709328.1 hydrogenase expression/formation protein [Tabrizicola rongguiensis]